MWHYYVQILASALLFPKCLYIAAKVVLNYFYFYIVNNIYAAQISGGTGAAFATTAALPSFTGAKASTTAVQISRTTGSSLATTAAKIWMLLVKLLSNCCSNFLVLLV